METNDIHNQTLQNSILRSFCIWNRELIVHTYRIFQSNFFSANRCSVWQKPTDPVSIFALPHYANNPYIQSNRHSRLFIIFSGISALPLACVVPKAYASPFNLEHRILEAVIRQHYLQLPTCYSIPVKNPADRYSRAMAQVTCSLSTPPFFLNF